MSTITMPDSPPSYSSAAKISVIFAALLVSYSVTLKAQQSNAQFPLTINLNSGSASGLCRSESWIGAFGTSVIVDCITGHAVKFTGNTSNLPWTTAQDNSNRYILNTYGMADLQGKIDILTSAGTITSWRLIKLDDQDYLELMVHW